MVDTSPAHTSTFPVVVNSPGVFGGATHLSGVGGAAGAKPSQESLLVASDKGPSTSTLSSCLAIGSIPAVDDHRLVRIPA